MSDLYCDGQYQFIGLSIATYHNSLCYSCHLNFPSLTCHMSSLFMRASLLSALWHVSVCAMACVCPCYGMCLSVLWHVSVYAMACVCLCYGMCLFVLMACVCLCLWHVSVCAMACVCPCMVCLSMLWHVSVYAMACVCLRLAYVARGFML